MTQRTINLYDGLEALYYFDSDYFDGTTGEIEDKSGHERHATAQGGPTVGVNGPNDFEAASFDGNDDKFVPSGRLRPSNNGESFCVFLISRANDTGSPEVPVGTVNNNNKGFDIKHDMVDNSMSANVADTNNVFHGEEISVDPTQYVAHALNIDGTSGYTYTVNGESKRQEFTSGEVYNIGPRELQIGIRTTSNGYFNGDIALAAVWSRALSHSEIERLNDLTAPLRAQL